MKWKSLSKEEKFKKKVDKLQAYIDERRAYLKGWHKHFAWWPVQVGDEKVWLETVYRKGLSYSVVYTTLRCKTASRITSVDIADYVGWKWEYKSFIDFLKENNDEKNN